MARERTISAGQITHLELIGSVYRLRLSVASWNGIELEVIVSHREMAQLRIADGQLIPIYLPQDKLRCFTPERSA